MRTSPGLIGNIKESYLSFSKRRAVAQLRFSCPFQGYLRLLQQPLVVPVLPS